MQCPQKQLHRDYSKTTVLQQIDMQFKINDVLSSDETVI